MPKMPSIPFYYDNYRGGIDLMTYDEKGRYMDLLCLQASVYPRHVSAAKFDDICGGSSEVMSKFLIDNNGCYYNERMKLELDKREGKSKKTAESINSRWSKSDSIDDTNVYKNSIKIDTNVLKNDNKTDTINDSNVNINSKNGVEISSNIDNYTKNDTNVSKKGVKTDTINNMHLNNKNVFNNVLGFEIKDVSNSDNAEGENVSKEEGAAKKEIRHKYGEHKHVLL